MNTTTTNPGAAAPGRCRFIRGCGMFRGIFRNPEDADRADDYRRARALQEALRDRSEALRIAREECQRIDRERSPIDPWEDERGESSHPADRAPRGFLWCGVWEISQCWGGPEEGGWWWDLRRIERARLLPVDRAPLWLARMHVVCAVMSAETPERTSTIGGPDFWTGVWEWLPPEAVPGSWPRYE